MTVHFRIGFKRWPFLVGFPGNQFIAQLLVPRKRFFDDDESGVRGLDVLNLERRRAMDDQGNGPHPGIECKLLSPENDGKRKGVLKSDGAAAVSGKPHP